MLSPEHNYLAPDTILQGRYRIMRRIGQGGMGAVYEALDSTISSLVAVKETFATTDEQRELFHREAKLLGNLHHEAFPHVTHHFAEGDGRYLVMELVRGNDLWELLRIREMPFPQEKVLEWADQLLDALHELHTCVPPIIHRDIKPPNMKLTPRGKIKLLDFGIAKGSAGHMPLSTSDAQSVVGYTPHFAPLEQSLRSGRLWVETLEILNNAAVVAILNTPSDARTDLYSLGATLYCLLTNQLPSDATTRALAIWSGRPDPVAPANQINPKVSSAVAAVLVQAMSLERQDRPASAAAMRQALRDAANAPPVPHPITAPAPEEDQAQIDREIESQRLAEAETRRMAETVRIQREAEDREGQERKERVRQAAEVEHQRQAEAAARRTAEEQRQRLAPGPTVAAPSVASSAVGEKFVEITKSPAQLPDSDNVRSERPPSKATWQLSRNRMIAFLIVVVLSMIWLFGPFLWRSVTTNGIRDDEAVNQEPSAKNKHGIEFVSLAPGTFTMGSPDNEADRIPEEGPQRQVAISRGFEIGKYEVTQAQWQSVMGSNPSSFQGCEKCPVEQVSWTDAKEFIAKLNAVNDGFVYRLPTEAEWEYAARAGTTGPFAFGGSLSSTQANFNGDYPYGGAAKGPYLAKTAAVGSYQPNAWGLFDMHGNIWEWCEDVYTESYAATPRDGSANMSGKDSNLRVLRGGSWDVEARLLRSAVRVWDVSGARFNRIGFRLVRSRTH